MEMCPGGKHSTQRGGNDTCKKPDSVKLSLHVWACCTQNASRLFQTKRVFIQPHVAGCGLEWSHGCVHWVISDDRGLLGGKPSVNLQRRADSIYPWPDLLHTNPRVMGSHYHPRFPHCVTMAGTQQQFSRLYPKPDMDEYDVYCSL